MPDRSLAGRPRREVKQTFYLYEGDYREVASLQGFGRIKTVLTVHLPAVKEGDLVVIHGRPAALGGEMEVLAFKDLEVRDGKRTALAVLLERDSETKEVGRGE